jgi:cell division protein FtsB
MKDFKEHRLFYGILSSWWLFLALLMISIWLARSGREAYREAHAAREEKERLEAQILQLTERRGELERKLKGFAQGEGIEEEVREKLFLKKPEEEVVIIVE